MFIVGMAAFSTDKGEELAQTRGAVLSTRTTYTEAKAEAGQTPSACTCTDPKPATEAAEVIPAFSPDVKKLCVLMALLTLSIFPGIIYFNQYMATVVYRGSVEVGATPVQKGAYSTGVSITGYAIIVQSGLQQAMFYFIPGGLVRFGLKACLTAGFLATICCGGFLASSGIYAGEQASPSGGYPFSPGVVIVVFVMFGIPIASWASIPWMVITWIMPGDQMGRGMGMMVFVLQSCIAVACLILGKPVDAAGASAAFAANVFWAIVGLVFVWTSMPEWQEGHLLKEGQRRQLQGSEAVGPTCRSSGPEVALTVVGVE